jgi:hypothetical protein
MARVGRFGRMPAEAPDLTSSLVAMMNQYRGQQDDNIFDAWENGGRYEGKQVSDAMLLDHIRDRRDELERDDPLWDEWNNRLWQYGFKIAEQKQNLDFQRTLARIASIDTRTRRGAREAALATNAANAEMRGFYTSWAAKLPRRSAAYRDLMSSAAQYSRAAHIAQQRSKGPLAEKDGPTDAELYEARIEAIQREYVMPMQVVAEALNSYAQSRGFIPDGGSVLAMGVGESAQLWEALAAGIQNDPAWRYLRGYLKRNMPGDLWGGGLSLDFLERMSDRAMQGARLQIAAARAYDGDMDSYILQYRKTLQLARGYKKLDVRLSASDDVMDGHQDWQEDLLDARDPEQELEANQHMQNDLWRAYHKYMKAGDEAAAGQVRQTIDALNGVTATAAATGARPVWGGSTSLVEVGETAKQVVADSELLRSGVGYIVPTGSPDYTDRPAGERLDYEKKYLVKDLTREPLNPYGQALVGRIGDDGRLIKVAAPLTPIYSTPNTPPEWYVAEWDNQKLYGRPLANADGTVSWQWTRADIFEATGIVLKPHAGSEGVGLISVSQDQRLFERQRTIFEQGPDYGAALASQREADIARVPEEERDLTAMRQQRALARANELQRAGLIEEDGVVREANALSAVPIDQEAIRAITQSIDTRLEDLYGPAETEAVENVRLISSMLPGSTGTDALMVQGQLVLTSQVLSSNSSLIASIEPKDMKRWAPHAAEVMAAVVYEPGMLGPGLADAQASWDIKMASADRPVIDTIRATEGSDNPRLDAGASLGRQRAQDIVWRDWDLMAETTGRDPIERESIRLAGRDVVAGTIDAVDSAAKALSRAFGSMGAPVEVGDLPRAPKEPQPIRGEPRIKTPNGLPGLGEERQPTLQARGAPPAPIRQPSVKVPSQLSQSLMDLGRPQLRMGGGGRPGSLNAPKVPGLPPSPPLAAAPSAPNFRYVPPTQDELLGIYGQQPAPRREPTREELLGIYGQQPRGAVRR